jgi:hypothetical protein
MNELEDQADNAKARDLYWKPLSWTIRPTTANDAFDPACKHVHSSLRCIQGARLDGLRARPSLPHGWTHGPRLAAQRKIKSYRQQYANNHNISFSRPFLAPPHACTANFCVFFFYRPSGRPAHFHCHWNAIATQIETVEHSRTRGGQSRSLRNDLNIDSCSVVAPPMHAPSSAPFLLATLLATLLSHNIPVPRERSLVRGGQTSPHTPRLVVSRILKICNSSEQTQEPRLPRRPNLENAATPRNRGRS